MSQLVNTTIEQVKTNAQQLEANREEGLSETTEKIIWIGGAAALIITVVLPFLGNLINGFLGQIPTSF